MGALISTIGTRYIVAALNRAFSPPRICQIRNQHPIVDPANQVIAEYFNPAHPGGDLLWLTQNIKHLHSNRANHECFLPEDETRSPRAVARWLYFLTSANPNVLTAANHVAIRNLIYRGLTDRDANNNLIYERIEFDAVDAKQDAGGNVGQRVIWSDEVDDHARTYMKIILVTDPINPVGGGALPALDPQPTP